jgi:hypothetical protein
MRKMGLGFLILVGIATAIALFLANGNAHSDIVSVEMHEIAPLPSLGI